MYGKKKYLASAAILAALPSMLGAIQHDAPKADSQKKPSLSLTKDGDVLWKPSVRGLSKYTFNLPKYGVAEAMRFEDTAALFYLSDISEHEFTVIENSGPLIDMRFTHESNSLELSWPISHRSLAGIKFANNDELDVSITGNLIASTTANSIHQIGIEIGEEIEIDVSGAKLNLGESSEHFYLLTASSLDTQEYSISYGQRYWQAIGDFDTAWAVGSDAGTPYGMLQLEKKLGEANAFFRLSTQSNSSPKLEIGLQINFDGGALGNWRVSASNFSIKKTAIDGSSLSKHRHVSLAPNWMSVVTPQALRDLYDEGQDS